MGRLRRDGIYVLLGMAVTFAVLLAIAVVLGAGFLLLMAIAPGRIRDILQELAPAGLHWAVMLAALLEAIYAYLLGVAQFISKGLSRFVLGLMGCVIVLALILGINFALN